MTVLCGFHSSKSGVWVGADSRVQGSASDMDHDNVKKIVTARNNKAAILFAGELPTINFINGAWVTQKGKKVKLINKLFTLLTKYGPEEALVQLVTFLREHEFCKRDDGDTHDTYGIELLLATGKGLWTVTGDLSVVDCQKDKLYAQGSGYFLAVGAAAAAKKLHAFDNDPEGLIRFVITITEENNSTCGGPINIVHLVE
jgi:ATP-dependent protease HslVU (ClpYQ) peptidase subunit